MQNQNPANSKRGQAAGLQDVPITNPLGLKSVYANHVGVSGTMTDLTIYFLEVGQVPGSGGPDRHQEIKSIVTIPIIMAQGLIQALSQGLQLQQKAAGQALAQAQPKQQAH